MAEVNKKDDEPDSDPNRVDGAAIPAPFDPVAQSDPLANEKEEQARVHAKLVAGVLDADVDSITVNACKRGAAKGRQRSF